MNADSQITSGRAGPDARKEFTGARLGANTAVASIGAAAAVAAATGALLPSIAALLVGGLVGYTITNQIPKNKD